MRRWLVVLLVMVAACSGGEDGPDPAAVRTCELWQDLAAEAAGGGFDMGDLTEGVRAIVNAASASAEPGLSAVAKDLNAAVIAGDVSAFDEAAEDMDAICAGL